MSTISPEDVKHLAELAKIKLSAEEAKHFAPQLDKIVHFFEQLKEVNTKNIEETSQTTGLENVWREDEIHPCEFEKRLLQCSSLPLEKDHIRIPNIF